ncbi:hsp70 nucleotide exchange factor fes1 [Mucor velutinosus]|uniref:Hsp70 nucleotide exchange factor fes1 n=1 Tax=Mucor velutinosus TaxID=708070 RepID=A0AAN7DC15_9FUNG|nr:hsp70 nucleotide exchange factor fes1 [Mucor velutinosus]
MSHIPNRAFIYYCPYPLVDQHKLEHVHQVAREGCSGQIALEKERSDSNQTVLQLVGLFGASDIKSEFKQRFNDMSLAIVSNDPHTIQMAQQLGCHCQDITTELQVNQDVVFVDFTGYSDVGAWSTLDIFVGQHARPDTIQCIISTSTDAGTEETGSKQQWWDAIVPRQSHLMKNGEPLKDAVQDQTLVYSYLHVGSSRQDGVSTFNAPDIKSKGSNGTILAWHLLAEIGHKLGFVPKYGA